MIRVQTVDGKWSTLAEHETAPAGFAASLFNRKLIEVVPEARLRTREWVNPAHVVRVAEQANDEARP